MATEYRSDGVPFLRSQNVQPGHVSLEEVKFISEEFHARLEKSRLQPGDVVIVRTGKPGTAAVIPPSLGEVNCADLVIVRPGPELDSRFLMYFVNTVASHYVDSHLVGAVQQHFNVGSARTMKIRLPPLNVQKAISEYAGSLESRIRLNQEVNGTLETMARAIFKSWFIDFDPVVEGHPLYPRSFQESTLGRIPNNWKLGKLEDLFILQRGFDLPVSERRPGTVPVIAASGFVGFHDEARVKGPGVVAGRSGVLGKVFLLLEDFWPLNTSLWIRDFRGSRPIHSYHLVQTLDFGVFNAGSAVPTLNRNHVHNLPVIVPPLPVVESFEQVVSPLFALRAKNEQQSETLAALRDALLPKLLSGAIRVKQAEKIVGEVV